MCAASGGQGPAILLYETALGLGLSVGPLVGAALGNLFVLGRRHLGALHVVPAVAPALANAD